MPRDPFWATLHKQQVEQMLRIADETEDYVYDELVPAIFPLDDPEERLAFYGGLDMPALQQNNPKLWQRYSKDALNLQQQDNTSKLDALGQLRSAQEKAWSQFGRQVPAQGEALGLQGRRLSRLGLDKLPGQQGFGMDTAAPMGKFSTGGSGVMP